MKFDPHSWPAWLFNATMLAISVAALAVSGGVWWYVYQRFGVTIGFGASPW